MFEEVLEGWEGEQVLVRHDPPSGTWMFVCMHSTRLGPAAGGTRMKTYQSPAEGLADGLRLAEGMTPKFAIAGLPFGGGKGVLAVPALPSIEERRRIVSRYAQMVASLQGSFHTGPDMNTSESDMDIIAEGGGFAFGRSPDRGGSGSSAADTAVGVFHGIRASAAHAFGSDDLAGRTALIQGVGEVGRRLAELLAEAGAKLTVSDVSLDRARDVADRVGATVVPVAEDIGVACDVFAPCAVGAVLNATSIPRLGCRVVAGSANNQLATRDDAELLRAAGILYAPDYVINGGGALHLIGIEVLGWDRPTLEGRLRGIGDTLLEIYRRADAEGTTTEAAADRIVADRLAAADRLPERG